MKILNIIFLESILYHIYDIIIFFSLNTCDCYTAIHEKVCAKLCKKNIKVFCACLILLDFLNFSLIFCLANYYAYLAG